MVQTHLDITSSAIQIQMQVFDLSIIRKTIVQIFLAGFLMDISDDNDPALDGAHGGRVGVGCHAAVLRVVLCVFGGEGGVDVHFGVGHDCGGSYRSGKGMSETLCWERSKRIRSLFGEAVDWAVRWTFGGSRSEILSAPTFAFANFTAKLHHSQNIKDPVDFPITRIHLRIFIKVDFQIGFLPSKNWALNYSSVGVAT